MSTITDRILTQLGDNGLIEKLLALPKSDLNSLLLKVFQEQAKNTTPVDVIKAFQTNRFSVPSEIDPVAYHVFEAELLSLAQKLEMKTLLLSPSAPFASCSTFGSVDQNNIVSATRGTEILSDPTNMLSIIISEQLKDKKAENKNPMHYCTTARVLRTQIFPSIKGYYSHSGMFCMVSSGKDTGSYICEKNLFVKHLTYYKKLLMDTYNAKLSIALVKRQGYTDGDGFFDRMTELVNNEFPDLPVLFDIEHEENNYYKGINFIIYINKGNYKAEIGGGGFVDWIQLMTNNKKERCLISAIDIDSIIFFRDLKRHGKKVLKSN